VWELLEAASGPGGQARSKTAKRIVRAAANLFVERGYKRTTMEEIASRAGVVKATLYLHAKNKAELLLMAIAAEKLAQREIWSPILDEQRPAEERMRLYVHRLITRAEHSPLQHRVRSRDFDFFLWAEDLDGEVKRDLVELSTEFHEHLLEQLAPGRFSSEERRKRAKVLMMFDTMASVLADPHVRGGLELEEIAAIMSEIVVDGLAPRGTTTACTSDVEGGVGPPKRVTGKESR